MQCDLGVCASQEHEHLRTAQGNFSPAEVLRWHEDGYFGLDLLLRCIRDGEDSPLRPLGEWMHAWQGGSPMAPPPPGFSATAAATSVPLTEMAVGGQTRGQAPGLGQAATPQGLQPDQLGKVELSVHQHGLQSDPQDWRQSSEAAVVGRLPYQVMSAFSKPSHEQPVQQHLHHNQHGMSAQAYPTQLQSLNGAEDLASLDDSSGHAQQHQHAVPSRPGVALVNGYGQQPEQHQQPSLQLQQEVELLHPRGLSPSLDMGRTALQNAAHAEGPAMTASVRPRLPAFAQLRAGGGSSQDAEQEADVKELMELLRPVPVGWSSYASALHGASFRAMLCMHFGHTT